MAVPISKPNLLLVEGNEEVFLFDALIKHMRLQDIQILPYNGKQKLHKFMKELVKMSSFRENVVSIGVERDANSNPKSAFQSVTDALKKNKLSAPPKVLKPTGKKPRVTVMIIPGINQPGMLEDICLKSVEKDTAMKCVDEYFKCLKKKGVDQPKNMSKARVHTFLASRKDPEKRLGEAAQANYWNFDSHAFDDTKKFLKQVALQQS